MKILVTGAGGFIGHILAERLQQDGYHDVIGVYRILLPDMPATGVIMVECDLSRELPLAEDVDYIVHCAAVQNPQELSVREFIDTNLTMMENVIHYAKRFGAKGIVFTSSISLHGEVRTGLLDENTDRVNPSMYGVSKYLCEQMLMDCQDWLPSVSLRLCGVIGPGANKGWLANVLAKALNGEDIVIVNENGLFNNAVHTDDLLQLLLSLFENGFSGCSAFPLASHSPVSIRTVVSEILKATGSTAKVINYGSTANSFMISNAFAMNRFNYQPTCIVDNVRKFAKKITEDDPLQNGAKV